MKGARLVALLASIVVGCGGAELSSGDDLAAVSASPTSEGRVELTPAESKSTIGKKESCIEIDGWFHCGLQYLEYDSYDIFYWQYGDEYCNNIPTAAKHTFCSGQAQAVCNAAGCPDNTSYYGFLCVDTYTLRCYADCWLYD